MVDEFNNAAGAILRAHAALKLTRGYDDAAEELYNRHELTLRRIASDLVDIRCRLVEDSEREGG